MLRSDLHGGLDQIDIIVDLGARALHLWRRPPYRGHNYGNSIAIVHGPRLEGQRNALDDNRGLLYAVDRDTPGHALGYPVVVIAIDEWQVRLQHLHCQALEVIFGQVWFETHVLQRVEEPVQVFIQPEDAVTERARGIEDRVTLQKAPVLDRYDSLALRYDLAIYVSDSLICHVVLPCLVRFPEPVANVPDGLDEIVVGVLYLASKAPYVNVDSSSASEILVAPDLVKQRVP